MKIVVLAKEVPDTYGDRKLDLETGVADRSASEAVLDEIGERSLEVALSYADTHPDTSIVLMSMAPASAEPTLRKGLAMGAASVVQIADERLAGADLWLTTEVLAAAIRRSGFDLVVAGNLSTDGSGGVLPGMIAELLDVPILGALSSVQISDAAVTGVREADAGSMTVTAELPAVISITERMPAARFPNFKGIMAAKKKPVERLSVDDLGIDPEDQAVSRSIMISVAEKEARAAGTKIVDEGDAADQLADFLVSNRLA
ncbi:MAG: electron transfer flavoprotein subunit beta [Subtercola sp.]|nr:electron transfer flavoprotein subunit beta [Subtercola sp.]